jgi:uncharacterized membrane protein YccC
LTVVLQPGIPNIGPQGVRKRRIPGIVAVVLGVAAVAALVASGAPRPWRLVAFLPFWLGSLGWFQAREKT